jgi:hypothetical protein
VQLSTFFRVSVRSNLHLLKLQWSITILLCLILFLPFYTVSSAESNVITPNFVGVWSGNNGVQSNPSRNFTMRLTLNAGEIGQIVGSIEYPSLACGGELTLSTISSNSLTLNENITFGSCVRNGIITLSVTNNGSLSYQWRTTIASSTATADLNKIGISGSAISTNYIGTWRGQGNGLGGSYSIALTIVPSSANSIAAAIMYPSLACGGIWTLQDIKVSSIVLGEDLDYGVGICVDNGVVTLIPESRGQLRYEWRTGNRVDTGQLFRVDGNRVFLPLLRK